MDTTAAARPGMAHDIFISHSTRDKPVADAVCATLETAGIRCWVAPRDVQLGRSFAGEITRAIQQSKAMVLIFSAHSNKSGQVLREVQLAVEAQLHILQFRIDEVLPNDDLKYYLSTPHWMDAMTPPLERHLSRLSTSLRALLGNSDTPGKPPVVQEPKPTLPILPAKISPSRQRNFWLPIAVAVVFLSGITVAIVLLRQRGPSAAERATATANARPTPSGKGALIFSDQFRSGSPTALPLFGPNVMTVANSNNECQITGKAAGILPTIFENFLVDDFILECGLHTESVPTGASYGLIFRASDIGDGGITKYYALLLDPHEHSVQLQWWDRRWKLLPSQTLPAGLVRIGQHSLVTLEAVGNRFRLFINGRFAAEFSNEGLNEGRVGFCLSAANATPWTVRYDDLKIFSLAEKKP